MVHRNTLGPRPGPKPYFVCPIWSNRKLPYFIRSGLSVRKSHTVMPSTNSLAGTAPNLVWPLTERSSFATDSFSNKKSGTFDHQRSPGRRAATGIRGGRYRSAKPGPCRRHSPRQRCQAIGHQNRELAQR